VKSLTVPTICASVVSRSMRKAGLSTARMASSAVGTPSVRPVNRESQILSATIK